MHCMWKISMHSKLVICAAPLNWLSSLLGHKSVCCLHALVACTACMHRSHAPLACAARMRGSHARLACAACMHGLHARLACAACMHWSHAPLACTAPIARLACAVHGLHARLACTACMHGLHALLELPVLVALAGPYRCQPAPAPTLTLAPTTLDVTGWAS